MKHLASLTIAACAATLAGADGVVTPRGLHGGAAPAVETVQQRDAEGRVRVHREVRLNELGDYVNHGSWRSWSEDGRLIGQGRYADGKPTGVWSRWAEIEDSSLLSTHPFVEFTGPFLSQATYRDGRLQGVWSIFDDAGRLVSEVHFRRGKRHGEAVLRTADGAIYRRSRFVAGEPVGEVEQRGDNGQLAVIATFEAGRRRIERVERYGSGGLKSREAWLGPLTTVTEPDDPWRVSLAAFDATGDELRHGRRESWWPNGQPKLRSDYRLGKAVGRARWWHKNGQLALEGAYAEGLATGDWGWWRENGVRAAACRYVAGRPVADASLWAADGRRLPPAQSPQLAANPESSLLR